MRTLDRYILTEYLKAFAWALGFFIALVIVVRLLDKDIKKFEDDIDYLTAIQIVLYQAPRRIMEVVPLAGFLAAFFVLGRMVRSNELASMKSAGVSAYRIVAPILVSTLFICGFFGIFYNLIASPAYHRATELRKIPRLRGTRNVLFKGQQNRLFYVQKLDLKHQSINRMTIYDLDSENNLSRMIFSESATWSSKHWHLAQGFVRRFNRQGESDFESFLQMKIERLEDPRLFAENNKDLRAMTIRELRQQITYKQMAGQTTRVEQVKMHHKMAYPFATLVVVLIGAPISIRFGKAGFFAGLVVAFFLSFLYWGISFATLEGLSENGLIPPFVACWGANILYACVGGILLWKTPK